MQYTADVVHPKAKSVGAAQWAHSSLSRIPLSQANCAGLIFSFQFAQNFVAHHFGLPYTPLPGMPVYNNVGDSLFFHSFNQKIPEKHTGWDGPLDYYKTFYTPKYGGGYAPFHFFTKRGVKIDRPPGL